MTEGTKLALTPVNNCVLVKLENTHKNFNTSENKYATRTSGIVVAVPEWLHINKKDLEPDNVIYEQLENKRIYFEEYKEGVRITKRDGIYCPIKFEDIRAFEDV